jgi:hypothetical protein
VFCSKASFVRIAAAVSIAIVCLSYRNDLAQEGPTVSLDYSTHSDAHLRNPEAEHFRFAGKRDMFASVNCE